MSEDDLKDRVSRAAYALAVEVPTPSGALRRGRTLRIRRVISLATVAVILTGGMAWGIVSLSSLRGHQTRVPLTPPPSELAPSIAAPHTPSSILAELTVLPVSREDISKIYLVDPTTGATTNITPDDAEYFFPTWSPDGTRIAVDRFEFSGDTGAEGIYVMNADGTDLHQILPLHLPPMSGHHIHWSPDGSRIAFVRLDRSNSGEESEWVQQLMVMDADGGNLRALTTPEDGQVHSFSWSPDGTQIVFTKQYLASERKFGWDLYVMPAEGGPATRLTTDGHSLDPSWSPDGQQIAFVSYEGDAFRHRGVYVMNADGSGRTRLTNSGAIDEYPAWAPDGSVIVFARFAGQTDCPIMSIHPDGTGEAQVATSEGLGGCLGHPDW
jgi:Tol biopolymer transport system component